MGSSPWGGWGQEVGLSFGLVMSFATSHFDFLHNKLERGFPKVYPYLNVVLPCGRAIFGLSLLAAIADRADRGAPVTEIDKAEVSSAS